MSTFKGNTSTKGNTTTKPVASRLAVGQSTGAPDVVTGTELPDLADRPGMDVLIYDGNCSFCRAQVQRLNWFSRGQLAYLSLHHPGVRELVPELTHEQLMKQMYVVAANGKRYGGADAIRYLTRKLPLLWPLCPLLHIPFSYPIWAYCYRRIASSRYRISGSTVTCDTGGCHSSGKIDD